MKHARPDYDRIQDPLNKIPSDEPVFLLRAQDFTAPEIVRKWAELNAQMGGVDQKLIQMALDHADLMERWQETVACKRADLPPEGELVPVRLPLVQIVERYVKLSRRGREWTGLCPFHEETSPSFSVVEDQGFYHCFGCGAHGTAIDFVMKIEKLDFAAAVEHLGGLTGIPIPKRAGGGP